MNIECLENLVNDYKKAPNECCCLDELIADYAKVGTFADLLSKALDPKHKNRHQYRIPQESMNQVKGLLLGMESQFEECKDFSEIKQIIEETVAANNIPRFKEVSIYDLALAIAAWKGKGFLPQVVYLHAGTKKGAMALFAGSIAIKGKQFLSKKSFSEPFQALEAWQIEDFLCRYKVQIKTCI